MLEAVYRAIYTRFENGGLAPDQIDRLLNIKNTTSEIPQIYLVLDPRVQVFFYVKNDRWLFIIYKRNKNLSISKRHTPDHFAINMRPDEVRDAEAVANHFCHWVLNMELQDSVADVLPDSTEFQNTIRGALLKDKKKRSQAGIESRMAQKSEDSTKNDFKWWWGFIIFLILGMIFFGSKVGGSSDCNWVSDPRGGYSDC